MLAMDRRAPGDAPRDHAADEYARPDVVPFEPWHLRWLTLQPSQAHLSHLLTAQHGEAILHGGPCFSLFVGYEVVACAGILEIWEGRAQVWSLLGESIPRHALSLHRAVTHFLDMYAVRRLECIVDPTVPHAVRWAERSGFTRESVMRGYDQHGNDQMMYVRMQHG